VVRWKLVWERGLERDMRAMSTMSYRRYISGQGKDSDGFGVRCCLDVSTLHVGDVISASRTMTSVFRFILTARIDEGKSNSQIMDCRSGATR